MKHVIIANNFNVAKEFAKMIGLNLIKTDEVIFASNKSAIIGLKNFIFHIVYNLYDDEDVVEAINYMTTRYYIATDKEQNLYYELLSLMIGNNLVN